MTIKELENELKILNVKSTAYTINGDLHTDTYNLNKNYNKWEYFYFDEKGNKLDYRNFDNEKDACKYFLDRIKNDLSYPTRHFFKK